MSANEAIILSRPGLQDMIIVQYSRKTVMVASTAVGDQAVITRRRWCLLHVSTFLENYAAIQNTNLLA